MLSLTRRRFALSLLAGTATAAAAGLGGRSRTLVLGGGPAGATAALALRRRHPQAEVVLIERDPQRLLAAPDLPFGKPPGADFAALQAAGVPVMLDEVTGIDWRNARLSLLSGREAAFDRLLLAPGSAALPEDIPGLDPVARHLWPAAWGNAREARRLSAELGALPEAGRVVLRLPASRLGHPEAVLNRAEALSDWLAANRPDARLTVLDGGAGRSIAARFTRANTEWQPAQVLGIDAPAGLLETDAGPIRADVVNFLSPQGAGVIARTAGLTDASGWCPCDSEGRSALRTGARILGDARRGALRTVAGARLSASRATA